jgi:hypothetical protein
VSRAIHAQLHHAGPVRQHLAVPHHEAAVLWAAYHPVRSPAPSCTNRPLGVPRGWLEGDALAAHCPQELVPAVVSSTGHRLSPVGVLCGCNRTAFGRRIMGFPVCIEDPKYGRNALIFNAGVVLTPRSEHTSDPDDFGPVVIKLASILHTLEVIQRALGRSILPMRIANAHACALVFWAVRVWNPVRCGQEESA